MLARGHDLLHEAQAKRLGGIEAVARQHPLHGVAPAGRPGEARRRAAERQNRARHLELREHRVVGCDDDVAREGELDAQREARALHGEHDGLAHARAIHAPGVNAALGHHREPLRPDAGHHVGQVEPAREVVAVRKDHADPQLGVAVELAVGQGQLLEHGHVGGIALLGPVEADQQQVPLALDRDARLRRGLGCGRGV